MLNTLRSNGFRVKIFESAADLGGTWYWNNYSVARTDSEYQFSYPTLFNSFEYTERFPGRDEVLQYFGAVEEKLQLKKDIVFNNTVTGAKFNDELNLWEVKSTNTGTTLARHLLLCIGFAVKSYLLEIKGLKRFQGEVYHPANSPLDKNVLITD